jgi:hypothetical protein
MKLGWWAVVLLLILGALVVAAIILWRRSRPARDTSQPGGRQSLFWRLYVRFFEWLDRRRAWHKLPSYISALALLAFRRRLREKNLHDTNPRLPWQSDEKFTEAHLYYRSNDGTWNDLRHPQMGAEGQRFGRNVPIAETWPEPEPAILQPSPRLVSERLLQRDTFKPAATLNLLAAAWIQFQVHDWFSHGDVQKGSYFEVELADGADPWPERPMRIPRTAADPHPDGNGRPPTFVNTLSHWWDASAIYGVRLETTRELRSFQGGKLILENGNLPVDPVTRRVRSGHVDNWWIGLALLHTLFAREHNAVCDRLRDAHPKWDDERLFQTARLIIAALTARIHTVEWTTAILSHPALKIGMNANWWGLAGERILKTLGRLSKSEEISGIPGSPTDHHGASYALTEEFVSVYRLHPLIPDRLVVRSLGDGSVLKDLPFLETAFAAALTVVDQGATNSQDSSRAKVTMEDVFYSFGIAHPGAITLHNYPNSLRDVLVPVNRDEPLGEKRRLDLAATDIMRDRERGVPRYNQFRRLLRLPPVGSFEELSSNPAWAAELREIYGDVDRVDLLVGLLAEKAPDGFGFSDTAFRIFILMASRRLKSDRFFTTYFNERVYSKVGIDWIQDNDMTSVLLRHYPALRPALAGVRNAFAPWVDLHREFAAANPAAKTQTP